MVRRSTSAICAPTTVAASPWPVGAGRCELGNNLAGRGHRPRLDELALGTRRADAPSWPRPHWSCGVDRARRSAPSSGSVRTRGQPLAPDPLGPTFLRGAGAATSMPAIDGRRVRHRPWRRPGAARSLDEARGEPTRARRRPGRQPRRFDRCGAARGGRQPRRVTTAQERTRSRNGGIVASSPMTRTPAGRRVRWLEAIDVTTPRRRLGKAMPYRVSSRRGEEGRRRGRPSSPSWSAASPSPSAVAVRCGC